MICAAGCGNSEDLLIKDLVKYSSTEILKYEIDKNFRRFESYKYKNNSLISSFFLFLHLFYNTQI